MMYLHYIFLLSILSLCQAQNSYKELLELKPLPSNYLYSSFVFSTSRTIDDPNTYDILPRSLLKIAQKVEISDLHLRFGRGRWNQDVWGRLPNNGQNIGGTGIEVWATFKHGVDVDALWKELVNSLSGLFCASMNYIDTTRTIAPVYALRNESTDQPVLYGILPSETVCTENLTPFRKLLPCKGQAGISSLLSGHKLFDTDWSSISIDLSMSEDTIQLSQAVQMVFDVERALSMASNPVPGSQPSEELVCADGKAYTTDLTCFPRDGRLPGGWSFESLFGTPIKGRCAASEHGSVDMILHHSENARIVPHSPMRTESKSTYVLEHDNLNLQVSDYSAVQRLAAPVLVTRSLSSQGSALHGRMTFTIINNLDKDLEFVYLTILPWFLRPFLHTLHTNIPEVIRATHYKPAKDRIQPSHVEMIVHLPASATLTITFDFERTILRYAEYPPDANRGFDIPYVLFVNVLILVLLSFPFTPKAIRPVLPHYFWHFLRQILVCHTTSLSLLALLLHFVLEACLIYSQEDLCSPRKFPQSRR